jgi:molybdenum cofactor biosynthesis enzyme MoaA
MRVKSLLASLASPWSVAPSSTSSQPASVDPIVESLWPLPVPEFSVATLRTWTKKTLQSKLTGDALHDNLILNKWEFAHGVTVLKSYPWRLSVPFVLCNAQCEFCAAWQIKGHAPLDALITALVPVIRHCYQLDLVGWGEPLIHPQFCQILDTIKREADPRARIALTTNGVRLDEWIDRLLDANVMDYAISIHAARTETHQDLMGLRPDDFGRVVAATKKLAARKREFPALSVESILVVTRQNLAEIPEFIAMSERLGVDKVHLRTLMPLESPREGLDYHRLPPTCIRSLSRFAKQRCRPSPAPDSRSGRTQRPGRARCSHPNGNLSLTAFR